MTLTVQNPGGTLNLMVNYTLISERPINPQDVVTEEANYQVAQVGFFRIFCRKAEILQKSLLISKSLANICRTLGFDVFLGLP